VRQAISGRVQRATDRPKSMLFGGEVYGEAREPSDWNGGPILRLVPTRSIAGALSPVAGREAGGSGAGR
jgi:hypothetical protein